MSAQQIQPTSAFGQPIWAPTLYEQALPRSLPPPHVDLAIIGGGYTGLCAAYEALEQGHSVAVFEQHFIGAGASGRNFGSIAVGTVQSYARLARRYGVDAANRTWQLTVTAKDWVEELISNEQIECDLARGGNVTLGFHTTHAIVLQSSSEFLARRLGAGKVRMLSKGEVSDLLGVHCFSSGLFNGVGSTLNPGKYLRGLYESVRRRHGVVCEGIRVERIKSGQGGRQELTHTYGVTTADRVVIATDGYTDTLVKGIAQQVFPIESYMVCTEPLSWPVSPVGIVFSTADRLKNYFRTMADGRFLFGGRQNLQLGISPFESAQQLKERMSHLFPQLGEVAVERSWSGRMGFTFDLMPRFGINNGIYYAAGYNGRGIAMASLCGRDIARLAFGKAANPLQEMRAGFRLPFSHKKPWFLAPMSTYADACDRIDRISSMYRQVQSATPENH